MQQRARDGTVCAKETAASADLDVQKDALAATVVLANQTNDVLQDGKTRGEGGEEKTSAAKGKENQTHG